MSKEIRVKERKSGFSRHSGSETEFSNFFIVISANGVLITIVELITEWD